MFHFKFCVLILRNTVLFAIYRKDDVDIVASKELSAVLEITSVLREWGEIWKQLFVVCFAHVIHSVLLSVLLKLAHNFNIYSF